MLDMAYCSLVQEYFKSPWETEFINSKSLTDTENVLTGGKRTEQRECRSVRTKGLRNSLFETWRSGAINWHMQLIVNPKQVAGGRTGGREGQC